MSAKKPQTAWQQMEPFVLGGASGMMATCIIQPVDMIKVRIQLLGEGGGKSKAGAYQVFRGLVAQEGFLSLYNGLSAALLRQATYTTTRFGVFRKLSEAMEKPGKNTTFAQKAFAGLVAGGIGSIVGTPADVALIRMQADATLPLDQRRNYTGVVNALTRIGKEEGMQGIFKGCVPVVIRAMSLNVGMLATHDQVFQMAGDYTKNPALKHLAAKGVAGFGASFFSLPFDFIKTRIQKQKPDANGVLPYKNMAHAFTKVLATEGPMSFYRGFWTYYARIAPHAMFTLISLDVLKSLIPK